MRIYFERSGGFFGMRISGTIDTLSLTPEETNDLHGMIEASNFFELPEKAAEEEGADLFHYKLVIEDEERQHSVELSDSTAPEVLLPLLRRLTVLTRSQGTDPT